MSQLDKLERVLAGEQPSWSEDWPTEPGFYWFYGWEWGLLKPSLPKQSLVHVFVINGRLEFAVDGRYLSKQCGTEGYWMPARVPEPPTQLVGGKRNE